MDFLQAVTALRDGLCEGITRPGWASVIGVELGFFSDRMNLGVVNNVLSDDWKLVGVKPQTETVEIIVWRVYSPSGTWQTANTLETAEKLASGRAGMRIVELRGVDIVPVKPKVKRREEITVTEWYWPKTLKHPVAKETENDGTPVDAKCFMEWEE